jgi:hypothetical protein
VKKVMILFLMLFLLVLTGCNEKEVVEDNRIKIEIIKSEYQEIEADVKKNLKEGENLLEKVDERVIFEALLEEELQSGYVIFCEELERQEREVPTYEEVRQFLKDFLMDHPEGEMFLEEFEEKKKDYRVVIVE